MRRTFDVVLLAALLGAACVLPAHAQTYQLVWQDEFDGTQVDASKWEAQLGTGCPNLCGWGNNELEYYRAQNATVSGGLLTITAKRENFGGAAYTSARLRTKYLGDWKYGRVEMRAKMPIGRGLWPALWMLPTDEIYGGWAASGEIDILEYLGHQPNRVFGTLHYGGTYPNNQFTSLAMTLASGNFNSTFHDFAFEWEPCQMRWYVDGALYATQSNWSSAGGPFPAPFDQRFHLLLNLAVGGNLPGPPDGSTVFPQTLVVDWVRVYQKPDLSACTTVFDGMDHAAPFANGWFAFGGSVGGGGIGPNTSDLPPVDGCKASLEGGWGSGGTPGFFGGFGRTRPMDLTGLTHFTMWIRPDPAQTYQLEINLQDDDNGDNAIPGTPDGADDEFQYDLLVSPSGPGAVAGGGWQRVSIPLAAFVDDNAYHFGGNGVFDPRPVSAGGNGQLVSVVVSVVGTSGSNVTLRTDRWAFTRQASSIAGRIGYDADSNGALEAEDPGLDSVTVELVDAALGTVVATRLTGADGSWQFGALRGDTYRVRVAAATLPPGSVATFDPDGLASAGQFAIDLACDQAAAGRDFGYALPSVGAGEPRGAAGLRNVPNPFHPKTTIEFTLAEAGVVKLAVYDVAGRPVRTLANASRAAGTHRLEWNATDAAGRRVPNGVYYAVLETARGRWTTRMAVLR